MNVKVLCIYIYENRERFFCDVVKKNIQQKSVYFLKENEKIAIVFR